MRSDLTGGLAVSALGELQNRVGTFLTDRNRSFNCIFDTLYAYLVIVKYDFLFYLCKPR